MLGLTPLRLDTKLKTGLKLGLDTVKSRLGLSRVFLAWVPGGDCWDVRQCFVRQLFGFSLTIQE